MKNTEVLGTLYGSIMGAVLTGIFVYFTGSVFSVLLTIVAALAGNWIGKELKLGMRKKQ